VLDYYPIMSLILALLVTPYKKILGFHLIEKQAYNKGTMMGLIGQIGLRFHLAVMVGMAVSF
jgi:1,4-dihydroxy-2-naphthoate polyprenyltransferase